MDTTQVDHLLRELEEADPADAADLAVRAAEILGRTLDAPDPEAAD